MLRSILTIFLLLFLLISPTLVSKTTYISSVTRKYTYPYSAPFRGNESLRFPWKGDVPNHRWKIVVEDVNPGEITGIQFYPGKDKRGVDSILFNGTIKLSTSRAFTIDNIDRVEHNAQTISVVSSGETEAVPYTSVNPWYLRTLLREIPVYKIDFTDNYLVQDGDNLLITFDFESIFEPLTPDIDYYLEWEDKAPVKQVTNKELCPEWSSGQDTFCFKIKDNTVEMRVNAPFIHEEEIWYFFYGNYNPASKLELLFQKEDSYQLCNINVIPYNKGLLLNPGDTVKDSLPYHTHSLVGTTFAAFTLIFDKNMKLIDKTRETVSTVPYLFYAEGNRPKAVDNISERDPNSTLRTCPKFDLLYK